MWFGAELCVWEAHRVNMVFLCFGARISVGRLSALIGPDGPPQCPSDLSTATILSSSSIALCQSSHQDRLHSYLNIIGGEGCVGFLLMVNSQGTWVCPY